MITRELNSQGMRWNITRTCHLLLLCVVLMILINLPPDEWQNRAISLYGR